MIKNLYGYAANNSEATARTLYALNKQWNVTHIGNLYAGAKLVSLPFCNHFQSGKTWNSHEIFALSDNGGEINVEPINHHDRYRAVPYTSNRAFLTAETMAWRIWYAMTNQEIDWNVNDIPSAIPGEQPLPLDIQIF